MSNLVYCHTCGQEMSINAYRCPKCKENDFTEYLTLPKEQKDRCSFCNGNGKITSSHDPLNDKTNLLGNGRHDTYNPIFKKIREQNPIEYTSNTCKYCNGYGYTVRQIFITVTKDKRTKFRKFKYR